MSVQRCRWLPGIGVPDTDRSVHAGGGDLAVGDGGNGAQLTLLTQDVPAGVHDCRSQRCFGAVSLGLRCYPRRCGGQQSTNARIRAEMSGGFGHQLTRDGQITLAACGIALSEESDTHHDRQHQQDGKTRGDGVSDPGEFALLAQFLADEIRLALAVNGRRQGGYRVLEVGVVECGLGVGVRSQVDPQRFAARVPAGERLRQRRGPGPIEIVATFVPPDVTVDQCDQQISGILGGEPILDLARHPLRSGGGWRG